MGFTYHTGIVKKLSSSFPKRLSGVCRRIDEYLRDVFRLGMALTCINHKLHSETPRESGKD